MTGCDSFLLARYLDESLTLPERRRLEEHLSSCPGCAAELVELRRIESVLSAWGSHLRPLPLTAQRRMTEAVEKRRRPFARPSRLIALSKVLPAALGTSIAAMLVVLSVNVGILEQSQMPAASSSPEPNATLLAQQSRQLTNFRRSSAILSGRTSAQQPLATPHRPEQADAY